MNWKSISFNGSRDVNEDSVGIIERGELKCFVVADGLGGHGMGDVASSLAIKAFEDIFSSDKEGLPELMTKAFQKAQDDILEKQKEGKNSFQMKTTVCALAVKGSELMWGHIGDTRLYAFFRNKITERTLDHSVPQMLVFSKEIKEKQIRNHPDRNRLLRSLGDSSEKTPKFELSDIKSSEKFQAFLLCSDGFWELVLEKEMSSLLKKSSTVEEWLEKMQFLAEKRGKYTDMDNYSAIAVWM